jgi:hypothetical protein
MFCTATDHQASKDFAIGLDDAETNLNPSWHWGIRTKPLDISASDKLLLPMLIFCGFAGLRSLV